MLPTYGSDAAAGMDLYAYLPGQDVHLEPGQEEMIPTGIALSMSGVRNMVGLMFPRSGLGSKGLVMGNLTGVIDADYQGELKVKAWNRLPDWSDKIHTIQHGDRIAQLVFLPILSVELDEVMEFVATERGANGWGSSGVK
jgi:dUTP pyrophosphatase